MEILFSVENFEEGGGIYREINSPRTLEACLRSGLDPSELFPKQLSQFVEKHLTKEMIDIKFETFEKKRLDKIAIVKRERNAIIQYADRKNGTGNGQTAGIGIQETKIDKASAMIEMEEKRIEALRRRQEKELNKIVEREQTMAALQMKIKRAEEEDIKKKKLHDKKVAELKAQEEKKKAQREADLKRLEQEEAERKRELARKEAEVQEKINKQRLQMEREMAREARERDEERKRKMEEYRLKTEALLKAQEEEAERNRLIMLEREQRIMEQLEQKKGQKRDEVQMQREKAAKRIVEAMEKHHELHEAKKQEFNKRQKEAEARAHQNEIQERERLKKQAEERDKNDTIRRRRLVDAFRQRADRRNEVVERRQEKDRVYDTVRAEREAEIAMLKFSTDLRLQDKLENVERVARMNEFRRLQTLQRIYSQDHQYEDMKQQKRELLNRHNEEAKQSLIRKHEISEAMERMRTTNDFTILDKLFASKKGKNSKKPGTAKGDEDGGAEDPRLAQTM